MRGGKLLYKCRLCGEIDDSLHAPDVTIALVYLTSETNQHRIPDGMWGGFVVEIMGCHHCGDGRQGVTDLVGAVEDKE